MEHRTALPLIRAWLWSGILLISLMILIGGITRLTGSGLSIVEWKLISGTIPPLNEQEWLQAFESYKQFPEYQKINFSMSLQEFKGIFWWEFVHRFLGRLTGLVFLIPFGWFLLRRQLSTPLIRRLLLVLCLGALQGLMGWIMVKSGLTDLPHVSHYRLAAHFSLALLLIAVLLWTLLDLRLPKGQPGTGRSLYRITQTLLLVLFGQIVLGAFVAGLKAGFSYNTFPLMGGQFFPFHAYSSAMDLVENGAMVQFLHRWFAFAVLAVAIAFAVQLNNTPSSPLRRTAVWLLGMLLVQILLGVFTLLFQVPLVLGVLHQLVAVVLFGLAVQALYYARAGAQHPAQVLPGTAVQYH